VRIAIERNRLPENLSIAAKVLPPEPFAQDRDLLMTFLILFAQERSAEGWPNSQHVEVIRRNTGTRNAKRIADARQVHIGTTTGHRSKIERPTRSRPIDKVGRRYGGCLVENPAPRKHQSIGIAVRQRLQKYGVDNTEDGRVCTDTQGQCEDDRGSKAGVLLQVPECISDVLCHIVQNREPPQIAVYLSDLIHTAELATRRCPSLIDRQATFHIFVSQRLEMRLNFVIQLRVAAALCEERDDA
jgi:hypothetical protein